MSDLRFLETYSKLFLLFLKSILIIFQFQSDRMIHWVSLNRPLSSLNIHGPSNFLVVRFDSKGRRVWTRGRPMSPLRTVHFKPDYGIILKFLKFFPSTTSPIFEYCKSERTKSDTDPSLRIIQRKNMKSVSDAFM